MATAETSAQEFTRIARGKRPTLFEPDAIDRLIATNVALTVELSVTRDRLDALERLLVRAGVVSVGAVDAVEFSEAEEDERESNRSDYLKRVNYLVLDEARRSQARVTES